MGTAKPNKQFKAETRFADLWFELGPNPEVGRSQIGLLGRLLTRDTAIEVFRNPATPFEIRSCQGKLFAAEAELVRQATKQDQTISASDLPLLLLIMPTASAKIRKGFGAIATTTAGVYDFPELDRTILVVVHQLREVPDAHC
jgi:hypothetical protein